MDYMEEIRSLKSQLNFKEALEIPKSFRNVVLAGMGGSGVAGRIFQEIYDKKPVTFIDSYEIPSFVDSGTVFIAISYSGNTEETVSATEKALKKGATILGVSSGGRLSEIIPNLILVPKGLQPRSAIGYLTLPLLRGFGLSNEEDITESVKHIEGIDSSASEFEKIANQLNSTKSIPVVFGTPPFRTVAYRWKTQFNENSKILAYSNYFPELNHNDTIPLRDTYRREEFSFFALTSHQTSERIRQRVRITSKLCGLDIKEISGEGNSVLSNLFTLIFKGDLISYYLAKYRGIDPREVSIIEALKSELSDIDK